MQLQYFSDRTEAFRPIDTLIWMHDYHVRISSLDAQQTNG